MGFLPRCDLGQFTDRSRGIHIHQYLQAFINLVISQGFVEKVVQHRASRRVHVIHLAHKCRYLLVSEIPVSAHSRFTGNEFVALADGPDNNRIV